MIEVGTKLAANTSQQCIVSKYKPKVTFQLQTQEYIKNISNLYLTYCMYLTL